MLANYNQTGLTWSQGDFNGDGTVDINDLTIVLAQLQRQRRIVRRRHWPPCPSRACLALLAAGLVGLLAYAWRK